MSTAVVFRASPPAPTTHRNSPALLNPLPVTVTTPPDTESTLVVSVKVWPIVSDEVALTEAVIAVIAAEVVDDVRLASVVTPLSQAFTAAKLLVLIAE